MHVQFESKEYMNFIAIGSHVQTGGRCDHVMPRQANSNTKTEANQPNTSTKLISENILGAKTVRRFVRIDKQIGNRARTITSLPIHKKKHIIINLKLFFARCVPAHRLCCCEFYHVVHHHYYQYLSPSSEKSQRY